MKFFFVTLGQDRRRSQKFVGSDASYIVEGNLFFEDYKPCFAVSWCSVFSFSALVFESWVSAWASFSLKLCKTRTERAAFVCCGILGRVRIPKGVLRGYLLLG